jgi:hypothetical protein
MPAKCPATNPNENQKQPSTFFYLQLLPVNCHLSTYPFLPFLIPSFIPRSTNNKQPSTFFYLQLMTYNLTTYYFIPGNNLIPSFIPRSTNNKQPSTFFYLQLIIRFLNATINQQPSTFFYLLLTTYHLQLLPVICHLPTNVLPPL